MTFGQRGRIGASDLYYHKPPVFRNRVAVRHFAQSRDAVSGNRRVKRILPICSTSGSSVSGWSSVADSPSAVADLWHCREGTATSTTSPNLLRGRHTAGAATDRPRGLVWVRCLAHPGFGFLSAHFTKAYPPKTRERLATRIPIRRPVTCS